MSEGESAGHWEKSIQEGTGLGSTDRSEYLALRILGLCRKRPELDCELALAIFSSPGRAIPLQKAFFLVMPLGAYEVFVLLGLTWLAMKTNQRI